MIKPEQVPKSALLSFLDEYNWGNGGENWARNCIAAAINSWPSGSSTKYTKEDCIILPLPQEKSND